MPLPESIRWTLLIWLVALGGCIGSFLNVVVYRLPRGQSLVHPGSRCPRCSHKIRWWHNLPVLGWVMLRGRCFDCGQTIAPRYPIVEAIVAFWFGSLALYGPLAGPFAPSDLAANFRPNLLWAIFAYHALLCCVLICLVQIDWDSESCRTLRYPTWICGIALVLAILAPIVDPNMHPISTKSVPGIWPGIAGVAIGGALGWVSAKLWLPIAGRERAWRGSGQMALVGAFLGPVAACAVGTAALVAAVTGKIRAEQQESVSFAARWSSVTMLVGVTICALAWRHF